MSHQELPFPDIQMLSPRLRRILASELKEGESLLWLDQQDLNKVTISYLPVLYFAIPFTMVVIFFMVIIYRLDSGVMRFLALDVLVAGFGLAVLILSLPIWSRWASRNVVYVLTDQRAMELYWKFNHFSVAQAMPEDLQQIKKEVDSQDKGNLVFAMTKRQYQTSSLRLDESYKPRVTSKSGFFHIRRVNAVEKLIHRMLTSNNP